MDDIVSTMEVLEKVNEKGEWTSLLKDKDIGPTIQEMRKSRAFFLKLLQEEFTGTLHCENTLGTLLDLELGDFSGKYDNIIQSLEVFYSIRCLSLLIDMSIWLWKNHWSLETVLSDVLCLAQIPGS